MSIWSITIFFSCKKDKTFVGEWEVSLYKNGNNDSIEDEVLKDMTFIFDNTQNVTWEFKRLNNIQSSYESRKSVGKWTADFDNHKLFIEWITSLSDNSFCYVEIEEINFDFDGCHKVELFIDECLSQPLSIKMEK
ncbi:MAG: hypothetical protein AB8F94_13055 [Saprospiraceae bacterium]